MELGRLIKALHTAEEMLNGAQEDQWQLPPNPVQNVGGAKSTTISNPTFNITADERRLRLRHAVVELEKTIELVSKAIEQRTGSLEAAIDAWQGHR